MRHSFFVDCVPPTVTAQQKGVRIVRGRPLYYVKGKVRSARDFYWSIFEQNRPPVPFDGALRALIVLTYPWRSRETNKTRALRWVPMPVRPDWDNLGKLPYDVLSELSYWNDDGQVFDGRVVKGWGERPGVRVTIETVEFEFFAHLVGAEGEEAVFHTDEAIANMNGGRNV